jgi:hypothetical protein
MAGEAACAQSAPAESNSASVEPSISRIPACDKPGGMGLSRIVEIDTTGGPGFGFESFKQYDFLHDKEVVLTFDDMAGKYPRGTEGAYRQLPQRYIF